MREQGNIFQNIDWWMVILYLALVLVGWINIYAAVYNEEHASILDLSQSYGRQLIWILSSLLLALIILILDPKFFTALAWIFYVAGLMMLAGVLIVGNEIAGSKSWIAIGSFALQPSEFAKISTNLALAAYLSGLNVRIENLWTKIVCALVILIPALLILLQNDTGSALVFGAFILTLYREGLSGKILLVGGLTVVIFILTLMFDKIIILSLLGGTALLFYMMIRRSRKDVLKLAGLLLVSVLFVFTVDYVFENMLEEHQKTRINVLLGKEVDLKGAGYNVHQSKIAIGSGGLWGKGFLEGTQTKYDFVPEQSTDFIFCTVGEEWGFTGSTVVVLLFLALFYRIIAAAERQRSKFSRIYGYGVFSILFFHFMINIGMTIGLSPVIGIPLPFLSYGGSSLWAFTILLFIFIRQDSHRFSIL
jgi:rod shape determining protein RodA